MFGMGPEKILLLAIVVLLLFGAKRIPEIGSSFGKGIREFKKSMGDGATDDEARGDLRAPARETDTRTAAQDAERQPRRLN
jgi:sec-independent protein translocase protein TatA